jgi:hypothetical protein
MALLSLMALYLQYLRNVFFSKDFAEILGRNWHSDDIHGILLYIRVGYHVSFSISSEVYFFYCILILDIVGVVHEVTFHQRIDSKLPLVMFVLRDIKYVLSF